MWTTIQTIAISAITSGLLLFVVRTWISERLRQSISHEYAVKLSALKGDLDKEFELFKREADARDAVSQVRWQTKREACLEALDIVDAVMSHMTFNPPAPVPVFKQKVDVAKARSCFSKLALACDNSAVLQRFTEAVAMRAPGEAPKPIGPDKIIALRNAIRKELGFGSDLELASHATWIMSLTGQAQLDTPAKP